MSDQLQIIDLTLGEGKECVKGALITTHYTGTLEDGTVFDSSHQRGRPFRCDRPDPGGQEVGGIAVGAERGGGIAVRGGSGRPGLVQPGPWLALLGQ